MDLQELVEIIPELTDLFLYGFIFMKIYIWLSKKQMELYEMGIWSLFINVLIKTFFSVVHSFMWTQCIFPDSVKIAAYVVFAVIVPFLIYLIQNSSIANKLFVSAVKKTLNENILDDVVDPDKRTLMTVYLKDSNIYYIGTCVLREEKGNESYICLIHYESYTKDEHEQIFDSELLGKTCVIINLRDVERIEILYEDDSEVWEFLNKDYD